MPQSVKVGVKWNTEVESGIEISTLEERAPSKPIFVLRDGGRGWSTKGGGGKSGYELTSLACL